MLWRCQRSLMCYITNKALPISSFHTAAFPKIISSEKSLNLTQCSAEPERNCYSRILPKVTSGAVLSVLRNCISDLIALSFFLWCAKQKNYFHDAQAFSQMVGVIENLTLRYKSVYGIIMALDNIGSVAKPQTFLLLLRIYWRGGMYERVFEVYEEMGRFGYVPNTFACNAVMDVLFRIGRVDVAIRVLKDMECPNFLSFNIALSNLCKVNDFHNIKDIIKAMLRKGFHPNPNTLEMILSCFCKVGRMREAYQVLCLMISLGLSVSVSIWSNLIHGSFLLCEPEKAIYLLKKMLESGWLPDVVTYTTLVKGFMDSQMVSQAFDVLQSMESRGLFPDLVLCNLLIGMYTKIGRYDDALEIFAKFPELGLEPDPHTFSSLLANICSSRRFSLFPMIADGVALEADLVVCNALLNYFCKAGFPSHAVKLYNDMIDKGLAVDNHSFVGLLNGLCRMGHVNEAIKVYQGLTRIKLGLDAHVHTIIASELIKAGELDKAISLFRKAIAERHVLDHVSYVVVIQGLLRSGRNREAYSLHKEMKRVGIVPNSQDYDVIITGCCRVRDVVVLGELLKDISAEQIELDVSTLVRVRETLCNTHPHPTVYREFCKIWNSRSMSSQMFDTTASDVNSCDFISVARYRDNPPDSSCSADHYEMAVSAC